MNGTWLLPPARSDAQLELYTHLTTIQLTTSQDFFEWEINGQIYSTYKTYKAGVFYDYLCEPRPDVRWQSAVWISRAIPRHSFHTWLLVQNRLPTRDRMLGWGLRVDERCLLCSSGQESRNHLFFSFNYSYDLWQIVARRLQISPIRDWQRTLDQMISAPPPQYKRLLTRLTWQSTVYWLWSERNTRLHANLFRTVDQIFRLMDRQLINKIQSFRETNPTRSSEMMQSWVRFQ